MCSYPSPVHIGEGDTSASTSGPSTIRIQPPSSVPVALFLSSPLPRSLQHAYLCNIVCCSAAPVPARSSPAECERLGRHPKEMDCPAAAGAPKWHHVNAYITGSNRYRWPHTVHIPYRRSSTATASLYSLVITVRYALDRWVQLQMCSAYVCALWSECSVSVYAHKADAVRCDSQLVAKGSLFPTVSKVLNWVYLCRLSSWMISVKIESIWGKLMFMGLSWLIKGYGEANILMYLYSQWKLS